jgi:hypothetical protein
VNRPLTFADLRKADTFARFPMSISEAEVDAYLEATGEEPGPWREFVPPVFLDALVVAALLERVQIPKGVMHTGQEHESHRAVRIDEPLTVVMSVATLAERRGAVMASFEAQAIDDVGEPVVTMKISVMVLPDGVLA